MLYPLTRVQFKRLWLLSASYLRVRRPEERQGASASEVLEHWYSADNAVARVASYRNGDPSPLGECPASLKARREASTHSSTCIQGAVRCLVVWESHGFLGARAGDRLQKSARGIFSAFLCHL
jgi:hypothetical protein